MKILTLNDNSQFTHLFFCEGCGCGHGFNTIPNRGVPTWSYNNDSESPTIQPSILVRSGNANGPTVCHSFVTAGRIQYLPDSTHPLAGQTVELTDMD
ncbi:DUF6527 family protein [Fibrella forsythiae]|uniref:Anaerobic dehydrogenase n=1 Tax=Fibrella forsythiae TaxID=2817061 RepID=A0ABS3JC15_9BACT|nr:DUF6527 family protein [Fibrella forsythiae]MBO0947520.1 anaerobic dehydrogenase [Fibrella forsythiae]